jgi:hypothetical protein
MTVCDNYEIKNVTSNFTLIIMIFKKKKKHDRPVVLTHRALEAHWANRPYKLT